MGEPAEKIENIKIRVSFCTPVQKDDRFMVVPRFVVGRGKDADLVFDHNELSRKHFQIEVVSNTIFISDLNSSNGTYLNGQKIEVGKKHELKFSDKISFGGPDIYYFEVANENIPRVQAQSQNLGPPPVAKPLNDDRSNTNSEAMYSIDDFKSGLNDPLTSDNVLDFNHGTSELRGNRPSPEQENEAYHNLRRAEALLQGILKKQQRMQQEVSQLEAQKAKLQLETRDGDSNLQKLLDAVKQYQFKSDSFQKAIQELGQKKDIQSQEVDRLSQLITSKNEELSALETKQFELNRSVQELHSQISHLESEERAKQEAKRILEQEHQAFLKKKRDESLKIESEVSELQNQLNSKNHEVAEVTQKVQLLIQNRDGLELNIRENIEKVDVLEQKLEAQRVDLDHYLKSNDQIKMQNQQVLDELSKTNDKKNEGVQKLEYISNEILKANSQFATLRGEHNKKRLEYEGDIELLTKTNTDLRAQNSTLESEIKSALDQLRVESDNLAEVQSKIEMANQQKAHLEAEITDCNKALKGVQKACADAIEKYAKAKEDFDLFIVKTTDRKKEINSEIADLENDKRKIQKELDVKANQSKDLTLEIEKAAIDLSDKVAELEHFKKGLDEQFNVYKKAIEEKKAHQDQTLDEYVNGVKLKMVKSDSELSAMREANEALKVKAAGDLESFNVDVKNKKAELQSQIEKIKAKLEEQKKNAQLELQLEIDELKGVKQKKIDEVQAWSIEEINKINNQVALSKSEIDELNRQISEVREGYRKEKVALADEHEEQVQAIKEQLKKKLVSEEERFEGLLEKSRQEFDSKKEVLDLQLSEMDESLDTINSGIKERQNQLSALVAQCELKSGQLKELLAEISSGRASKEQITQQVSQLKKELESEQIRVASEKSDLKNQWIDFQNNFKTKKSQLEVELADFNKTYKQAEIEKLNIEKDVFNLTERILGLNGEYNVATKALQEESEKLMKIREEIEFVTDELTEIRNLKNEEQSHIENAKKTQEEIQKQIESDRKKSKEEIEVELGELRVKRQQELEEKLDRMRKEYERHQKLERKQLSGTLVDLIEEKLSSNSVEEKIVEEVSTLIVELVDPDSAGHVDKVKESVRATIAGVNENKTHIYRLGKKAGISVMVVVVLGLLYQFNVLETLINLNKGKKSISQKFIERTLEERKEKNTFRPEMTGDYKRNYTQNIVYTMGFIEKVSNPEFQDRWILELNQYLLDELHVSEEIVPELVAMESVFIKELISSREKINPETEAISVSNMEAKEEEFRKEASRLLGSDDKYKSYFEFGRKFYQNY